MPIRKPISDISLIGIDPQASQRSDNFIANEPRISRDRTDWEELGINIAKIIGTIAVKNKQEDIKEGQLLLEQNQNDINQKLAKRETSLAGFAQLVSLDKLAESKSPGQVIGFRQAAGRLLGQQFTLQAQSNLDTALNQEFGIDPNTTLPTARQNPADVIRNTERDFEQNAANGSAAWLLQDYYGKETYLDLKAKASSALLNEYQQRFDDKQKNLHRDMLAAEGVSTIINLQNGVDIGEISPEQAREDLQNWVTKRVYLGSVKDPSQFVTSILGTAIEQRQIEERKRVETGGIPSTDEVGTQLFNTFKTTKVGTDNLDHSQPLAFTKIQDQLLNDQGQNLSRANSLYEANKIRTVQKVISDPNSIHSQVVNLAREPEGEFVARRALDDWYTKALASKTPYAEDIYNDTLRSLNNTIKTSPEAIDQAQIEDDSINVATKGDFKVAREIADMANPENRIALYQKLDILEKSNITRLIKDPEIQGKIKGLSLITGTKGLKDVGVSTVVDTSSLSDILEQDNQDLNTLNQTITEIATKELPIDEQRRQVNQAINDTQSNIKTRYKDFSIKNDAIYKTITTKWEKNQSAEQTINDLLNNNQVDEATYNKLRRLDATNVVSFTKEFDRLRTSVNINNLVDRTFQSDLFDELSLQRGLIRTKGNNLFGTKYETTDVGLVAKQNIVNSAYEATMTYFKGDGADLIKDPITKDQVITNIYNKNLQRETQSFIYSTLNDSERRKYAVDRIRAGRNEPYFSNDEVAILARTPATNAWEKSINSFTIPVTQGTLPGSNITFNLPKEPIRYRDADWENFNQYGDRANGISPSINAAGEYKPNEQSILFAKGMTFTNLLSNEHIGDPRYSLETSMAYDRNGFSDLAKTWKDRAIYDSNRLTKLIVESGNSQLNKEVAINDARKVTGLDYNDVLNGEYTYFGQKIKITDPTLIHWQVTPLFKTKDELRSLSNEAINKLMSKLNIKESDIPAFIGFQERAINRIQ